MWKFLVGAAASLAFVGMAATAVAAEEPDMCISVNGDTKVQKGTATCSSVDSESAAAANVARAMGDGAFAAAGFLEGQDSGNRATASGDNSVAGAFFGDGNTATATGDDSFATASNGFDNTAIATGDGSIANASNGSENIAIASGDNSGASAAIGNGNLAIATGDGSFASAGSGVGNIAIATTDGCTATAIGVLGGLTDSC